MTATVELDEQQVRMAVRRYMEAQGWQVDSEVRLDITAGSGDGRDYTPSSVRARAVVRPGRGGTTSTCRSGT